MTFSERDRLILRGESTQLLPDVFGFQNLE